MQLWQGPIRGFVVSCVEVENIKGRQLRTRSLVPSIGTSALYGALNFIQERGMEIVGAFFAGSAARDR